MKSCVYIHDNTGKDLYLIILLLFIIIMIYVPLGLIHIIELSFNIFIISYFAELQITTYLKRKLNNKTNETQ